MEEISLSSTSDEEEDEGEESRIIKSPSPYEEINWHQVIAHSRACEAARNAGRRRRCREYSRRFHPYRFANSDEDFSESIDEWLHRIYSDTGYCPCNSCVVAAASN